MKIDFHAHFYPKEYIKLLLRYSPHLLRRRGGSKFLLHSKIGFAAPLVKGMYDIDEHIRVMNKEGVGREVLSLAPGWPVPTDRKRSMALAKIINDRTAEAVAKHPDRFSGLATLPLVAPDLALDELKRAVDDLGLRGCIMSPSVGGKPLDALDIAPIFRELEKRRLPIFLHPNPEFRGTWFNDYCLITSLGLAFDTTTAVVRLAVSGTLEQFPDLKIVAAHCGGAFPYLAGRVDKVTRAFPYCDFRLRKPPSEYMKNVFVDVISFNEPALRAACEFLGPDKLVIGTDYPFTWGTATDVASYIKRLGLPKEDLDNIYTGNAAKLLHL